MLAESAAGRLRYFALALVVMGSFAAFVATHARGHHGHHHHGYTHVGRCLN